LEGVQILADVLEKKRPLNEEQLTVCQTRELIIAGGQSDFVATIPVVGTTTDMECAVSKFAMNGKIAFSLFCQIWVSAHQISTQ
jgi:hypothetical protein